MPTVVLFILVLVLFLLAFLLFRTALFNRPAIEPPPTPEIDIDGDLIAGHLARVIQFQTVSPGSDDLIESGSYQTVQAFLNQQRALQEMYPRVHSNLQLEAVQNFSLLFTWPGSDDSLKPILLMAHQDVVPVEEGNESRWEHPPFSGQIADGYVWGRGSLDIKNGLVAILEAVEWLLRNGFQPRRTIYLAFGHDEEGGGMHGARQIANLLHKRGVVLENVLDEGGVVLEEMLPGFRRPVGMVGLAEKGYLSLDLDVETQGGHSSAPDGQTSIGILASAIQRLEANPPKTRLVHLMQTLRSIASELPLSNRLVLANTWLFRPLVEKQLQKTPRMNALLRTTTAPTIISAGIKDNVLPCLARAVINCRILPGETIQSTLEHVIRTISDRRVQVRPMPMGEKIQAVETQIPASSPAEPSANGAGAEEVKPAAINGWEASPVSPADSQDFALLELTIRQIFPEALVAPFLMMGTTDSRHYSGLTENIFRFMPVLVRDTEIDRIHCINERISVENCGRMVRFYIQWIRNNDEIPSA